MSKFVINNTAQCKHSHRVPFYNTTVIKIHRPEYKNPKQMNPYKRFKKLSLWLVEIPTSVSV